VSRKIKFTGSVDSSNLQYARVNNSARSSQAGCAASKENTGPESFSTLNAFQYSKDTLGLSFRTGLEVGRLNGVPNVQ
jgi:hypothetical protein